MQSGTIRLGEDESLPQEKFMCSGRGDGRMEREVYRGIRTSRKLHHFVVKKELRQKAKLWIFICQCSYTFVMWLMTKRTISCMETAEKCEQAQT